jgi:protein-disulfide isomerase
MREISKFLNIVFFFLLTFTAQLESKILSIGSADAKVTVKVFSSLTCPHCASFHDKIFNNLKKDFIDKGLVRFEHHAFPLDLAALNAEVVIRCQKDNEKKFRLLEEIYNKQKFWAVGSDIDKINELIKKIGINFDLTEEKMNKCLNDNNAQDKILNQRIEAQKKYKIESTPTIFINEKKFTNKKVNYKSFKKIIEKNL